MAIVHAVQHCVAHDIDQVLQVLDRWQSLKIVVPKRGSGSCPQRLLWASTGTKDPRASDILYVKALAAPFTVNTIPEGTLHAFAEHGVVEATMPTDGGDCEEVLARFGEARIDVHALSVELQEEGAKSFVHSWRDLLGVIESKCALLELAI